MNITGTAEVWEVAARERRAEVEAARDRAYEVAIVRRGRPSAADVPRDEWRAAEKALFGNVGQSDANWRGLYAESDWAESEAEMEAARQAARAEMQAICEEDAKNFDELAESLVACAAGELVDDPMCRSAAEELFAAAREWSHTTLVPGDLDQFFK